ncbi:MFS transporter [Acidisphaera sp. S103]|uniref:MFS transporter n=1 Tax=Acidisphaera sp. S103 TaxID=1747223 RepID=UPI00131DC452|nr:MFS transporter [Acidisphaera sp. S103]
MSSVPQFLADGAVSLAERKSRVANGDALILAASSLGCCLVFMSGAIINVAIAAIGRDEGLSSFQLQWIINAEGLPVAALTLVSGAFGDRFGYKRMFIGGLTLLAFSSIASALAPDWKMLVGARSVAGIAEALILPNGLSILGKTFPADMKARAVGIWSAVAALACAVGPGLAGVVIDHGSWRMIFLMNIPIILLALTLTITRVPDEMVGSNPSIDAAGALLSALCLGALGWSVTNLTNGSGLSARVSGGLIVALAALVAFVLWERHRRDQAMIPLELLSTRTIAGANLFTILLYGSFAVVLTILPFVMIRGAHLPTLVAGMAFIPLQLSIIIVSPLAGTLCRVVGRRPPLILGAIVTGMSCLASLKIGHDASYWPDVFPAVFLFSIGMSLTVAPLTTLVLTSVDVDRAGTAAGVNNAASRAGSLLAIASLGGILQLDGDALLEEFRIAMLAAAAFACLAAFAALLIKPGPHVDWVPID